MSFGRVLVGVVFGVGSVQTAAAQQLDIEVDPQAGLLFDANEIEQQVNAEATQAFQLVDPQTFVDSMANAAGISAKGMGVDYASNFDTFVIGGSFGSSVHSSGFRFNRSDEPLPPGGFAFMVSAMGGLNLGGLGAPKKSFLNRVRIFANGMAFEVPSGREFGGQMYNLGAHLQVKLVPQAGKDALGFGGLDLTSGFEQSRYTLSLREALPLTAPLDGGEVTWDAAGTYDIVSTTSSVPVELSTNVGLSVITVFAGAGVDVFLDSSSTSSAAIDGPLRGAFAGQEAEIGSARLSLDVDGAGDRVVPRAFGGAQINLLMFKVYGHLNAGLNGAVGGHVGARLAM